uniref:Uncharacterized protein n=1 Tax=Cyanistes caeruleus TaxID=156563 RepID=A0A8C0ZJ10_CYACU
LGGTRLLSAPASPNRLGSALFGRKSSQNGCPGPFPHKNKAETCGKGEGTAPGTAPGAELVRSWHPRRFICSHLHYCVGVLTHCARSSSLTSATSLAEFLSFCHFALISSAFGKKNEM